MAQFRVMLTDYAWPELDIERSTLAAVDAELIVAPRGDEETLIACAAGVDAILTCWAKVTERVIRAAPGCRIVSRLGIGLDNIDIPCCTSLGIPVTNVPDYCLIEVAEHTLALVLALGRKVAHYHAATKAGIYDLKAGPTLRRLQGQTVGIVGLGNIGRTVAEKALALGFRVLAATRTARSMAGVQCCSLEELVASSDYVTLHAPLTPQTRHMINHQTLALMKPTAFLINTSRGGMVDHAALADALDAGRLAGAALDVQDPEPPDLRQRPYCDQRVIVTPHAAFVSVESLENLRRRGAQQVADRLVGRRPENIVNGID